MSGIWIGLDFGTTHSCAAVWDSTRGRPKVVRLQSALVETTTKSSSSNHKWGRLVPTVLVLVHGSECHRLKQRLQPGIKLYTVESLGDDVSAVIGAPALQLLHSTNKSNSPPNADSFTPEQVSAAMIENLKQAFFKDQSTSSSSRIGDEDDSRRNTSSVLTVTPLGSNKPMRVETVVLVELFLSALRLEAQDYLDRNILKKQLKVPHSHYDDGGGGEINASKNSHGSSSATTMRIHHAVLGVPCAWSQTAKRSLEKIAVLAGFESAHAVTEPTAACLSYGLGVATTKTVLVFDMGGGTTDVTIAELQVDQQKVLVTMGAQVGGNDLDKAILEWVVNSELKKEKGLSPHEHHILLQACKDAKEDLCTTWSAVSHVNLVFQDHTIRLDKKTFEKVTKPSLDRAQAVVEQALQKYGRNVKEVVLVGGSTRVPAVPAFLTRITQCPELCSVHPLTSVAQGAAIHAARISSCVPIHELQSALLLDALPYAIGVLSGDKFVEVLQQYSSVPSRGAVKFALADKEQTGVTLPVLELIDEDHWIEIQSFQFLLRKLSPQQLQKMSTRWIEVRLEFTELGQLIVTVVDENDPEHQRRYMRKQGAADVEALPIGLVLTCIALAFLYLAVKLAFHEVELKGRR